MPGATPICASRWEGICHSAHFLVDWYFVDRTLLTKRLYYPDVSPTINNDRLMQVVTSSPVTPWPDIMQGYVRILLQASIMSIWRPPISCPLSLFFLLCAHSGIGGVDVH